MFGSSLADGFTFVSPKKRGRTKNVDAL